MPHNWKPLGLGGYGNMTTPAMSRLVQENEEPDQPHMLVNCDMGALIFRVARGWGEWPGVAALCVVSKSEF